MDRFHTSSDSVSHPARSLQHVDLASSQPLPVIPKALFVGTGGDVRLRCVDDGEPVICRNVPDGSILPVRAAQLYADGTTASDIVALY